MKTNEFLRLLVGPLTSWFYGKVRRDLKGLLSQKRTRRPEILDVGARESPYTAGLPARVTLLDLPRETKIQEKLRLGMTPDLLVRLQRRRSNIEEIIVEDMTTTTLASDSFDGVICVEVIEHVKEDRAFVEQVARVLHPDGWAYFTTPNGDYIRNEGSHFNPDHVRHYTREELAALLSECFREVEVTYGVRMGRHYCCGQRTKRFRQPVRLVASMIGNLMTGLLSRGLEEESQGTVKLFAKAFKPIG